MAESFVLVVISCRSVFAVVQSLVLVVISFVRVIIVVERH